MAGNDYHRRRRLDGRVTKKAQAELGILVVPSEQCALGYLGSGRPGMGAYRFAACARGDEYSRRREEPAASFVAPQIPVIFSSDSG